MSQILKHRRFRERLRTALWHPFDGPEFSQSQVPGQIYGSASSAADDPAYFVFTKQNGVFYGNTPPFEKYRFCILF